MVRMVTKNVLIGLVACLFSGSSFAQWDVLNDFAGLSHGEIKYFFNSEARGANDLKALELELQKSSSNRNKAIAETRANFAKALKRLQRDIERFERKYPNNKNLNMFFDSLYNSAKDIARDEQKITAKIDGYISVILDSYAQKVRKASSLDNDMRDIYWRGERKLTKSIRDSLSRLEEVLKYVMMRDGDFSRYAKYKNLEIYSFFLNSHKGFHTSRMAKYMRNLPPILKTRSDIVSENRDIMGRHSSALPPIMFNLKLDRSCVDGKMLESSVVWKRLNFRVFDQVFKFNEADMENTIGAVAAIMKNDSVRVVCRDVWSKNSIKTVYSSRENTIYLNYKYKPVRNCRGGGCRSPYYIADGITLK